jgi:hypothetical protein
VGGVGGGGNRLISVGKTQWALDENRRFIGEASRSGGAQMENALRKARARISSVENRNIPYATQAFQAAAEKRTQSLLARLRRTYAQQGLVLYLGAGVSASASFTAWNPLISGLLASVFESKAFGGNEIAYELGNAANLISYSSVCSGITGRGRLSSHRAMILEMGWFIVTRKPAVRDRPV